MAFLKASLHKLCLVAGVYDRQMSRCVSGTPILTVEPVMIFQFIVSWAK